MKRILASIASFALATVLLAVQAAPAAPPASASGARAVIINHFAYHPGTLEVAKGARVVFSNAAGVAHTVTDRRVFDSGHIRPGHSFAVRFEQKGTFRYHCEIHPFMHGKIVVG